MRQFSYLCPDGSFDYDRYREVQIAANKAKINNQWVSQEAIEYLADYISSKIPQPGFGLCHGTRRGLEQAWFAHRLNCNVIGTEISDTATQFPSTIQWDFHDVKPEWLGNVDFIYSNSWDHSYDPVKLFNAWTSCLRPGGILVLEHNVASVMPNETDPLGLTLDEMVNLINEIGNGGYQVDEVLRDGPLTGLPGMQQPAVHVVVRRRGTVAQAAPRLGICTIMAGERLYLEEWLAFHQMQGVSSFHIYLDRSRADLQDDGTEAFLRGMSGKYGITVEHWTGGGASRQVAAFDAGAYAFAGHVDWAAFIDADEFLFHPDMTLTAWLAGLPSDVSAVGVQQTVFGSSGRLDRPSMPVTAAYELRATRSYPEHTWFKSIVRPDRVVRWENSHFTATNGRYVLGDGAEFEMSSEMGSATRIAESGLRLHHYIVKSREEWRAKKTRGAMSDGAEPGFVRFTDDYLHREEFINVVHDQTLSKLRPEIEAHMNRAMIKA